MRYPPRVTVVEVGPRDGLQNEAAEVSTADKVAVDRLSDAGRLAIEVPRSSARSGCRGGGRRRSVRRIRRRPGARTLALAECCRARARRGGGCRRGCDSLPRPRRSAFGHQSDHRAIHGGLPASLRAREAGRRPHPGISVRGVRLSVRRCRCRRAGRRALRSAPRNGCIRSGRQRHHRRCAPRSGRRGRRCSGVASPLDVSRCTSTTRGARRWQTCSRPSTSASRRSTRRPADSGAAPTRQERQETWPRKI